LVVSQNGKVIYRLPGPTVLGPSPGSSKSGKASASRVPNSQLTEDRLLHRVQPQYPADALARRVQGAVVLDLQIGGDGAVKNIAVVEGAAELADAAVEAVRQWRYRPYTVDGKAVEMQTRVTIRFTLPAN
jgi:protein TonB